MEGAVLSFLIFFFFFFLDYSLRRVRFVWRWRYSDFQCAFKPPVIEKKGPLRVNPPGGQINKKVKKKKKRKKKLKKKKKQLTWWTLVDLSQKFLSFLRLAPPLSVRLVTRTLRRSFSAPHFDGRAGGKTWSFCQHTKKTQTIIIASL